MSAPKRFLRFMEENPAVGKAYDELGEAIAASGPLDPQQMALVKIGISAGAKMEGALRSHVRKALECGVNREEIKHAVILTTTTVGFPNMMAALSWIDDLITDKKHD